MQKAATFVVVFLVLSAALVVAATTTDDWLGDGTLGIPIEKDQYGTAHPICPTDQLWKLKAAANGNLTNVEASCAPLTSCDIPSVRDGTQITQKTINLVVHLICDSKGACPDGIDDTRVKEQIDALNTDYKATSIQFAIVTILHHNNDALTCISAYGRGNTWYYEIMEIKELYASLYTSAFNIFVSCQDPGNSGTLLGIGTFPWDAEALTPLGGVWMNAQYTHRDGKTLAHEMGHNLGLWHTFHGVSEVTPCQDPCAEAPHAIGNSAFDTVGDYCSDTRSTPTNYYCQEPTTSYCNGTPYKQYGTDLTNFMAYTPDNCMNTFSAQQISRAHCYICGALVSVLANPSACDA